MPRTATRLLKATLDVMHFSGVSRLLAPYTRGAGVVFMLHHVSPEVPDDFEPNRILKVTPDFLARVVDEARRQGFDIVSLDEVHRRLQSGVTHPRPFAAFTFDDGYRDNKIHAWPLLRREGVPFTIYVPTDFPDGEGFLWWLVLERVIRAADSVTLTMEGALRTFSCASLAAKESAFDTIYWWMRALPEYRARTVVAELAAAVGVDAAALCRDLVMTWDELREMARDPLVTIGAHTRGHLALAKLSAEESRAEIAGSVARIERELGRPCRHFSFPYGDATSAGEREFDFAAALGLATAVTTRKGVVLPSARLSALPRVSLNGDYQKARYVEVLMSGAPFAMLDVIAGRRAEATG